MKKRGLLVFGILILWGISFVGLGSTEVDSPKEKIDHQVFNALKTEESVRVIVLMNDNVPNGRMQTFGIRSPEKKIVLLSDDIPTKKVKRQFIHLNGFSAELTLEEITNLEKNENVERIYFDRPVYAMLQESVPLINASSSWSLQIDGVNLTGEGETVCVIDTGIDYTHPDLGGCEVFFENNSGINESYILESEHPYRNNFDFTWKITREGYSSIAIHFVNLSLEYPGEGGYDTLDRIIIYDSSLIEIARYHGSSILIQDLWTPFSEGDTIYVRLVSDILFNDYGFYIDQIRNGTTDKSYNWDNCEKVVGGWDFYNNDGNPLDDDGHGTHCAGIVAGNGNINGVAPGAKLIAIKSLGDDGGYISDVISGIDWCISNRERYNISVISMSLGDKNNHYSDYCDDIDELTTSIIDEAVLNNISIVIASGNEDQYGKISFPACIQNATAVTSSVKLDNNLSSFANRWNNSSLKILAAPGGNLLIEDEINSTMPIYDVCLTNSSCTYPHLPYSKNYSLMSGTSMSTPHVAGAIAIINQYLKLKGMTKTPSEIENILIDTGKEIEDPLSGRNFSRIDVYSALRYLCEDNLINTSWEELGNLTACRINDTWISNFSLIQYDENNCGFTSNVTFYSQNETFCDYCIPNWTDISEGNFVWFNDTKDCYNKTKLGSDLEGRPQNYTLNVSENQTQMLDNENKIILELNFNITNSSENSSIIKILKEENSSNPNWIIVRGLNLFSEENLSKSIYFNKTKDKTTVCVVDREIESIENVSEKCNGTNETLFDSCNTSNNSYTCTIEEDGRWKISGLKNSAIKEVAFCGDGICNTDETCSSCPSDCGVCPSNGGSGGGSGGGGGGGGSSSGSGGGSGGGGGGGATTITLGEVQIKSGENLKIAKGDLVKFRINEENHTIKINSINLTNVNLTISSEPINMILGIGEERKLNLSSNEYYDLYLKLENISGAKINLIIREINESILELVEEISNKEEMSKQTPFLDFWNRYKIRIAYFLIFIVTAGLVIFFLKNFDITKKTDKK